MVEDSRPSPRGTSTDRGGRLQTLPIMFFGLSRSEGGVCQLCMVERSSLTMGYLNDAFGHSKYL